MKYNVLRCICLLWNFEHHLCFLSHQLSVLARDISKNECLAVWVSLTFCYLLTENESGIKPVGELKYYFGVAYNICHGVCHVLPAGRHVDCEGEKDGSQAFRAHPLPTYAPRRLPQSDGPPLHVLLLWCWGLLWWHQLGQLPHAGLADTKTRWLMLHWVELYNKHDVIRRKCDVCQINMLTMLVF